MNSSVFFMLAGVLIVAGAVLWLIFRLNQNANPLDVNKYRMRWLEIETIIQKSDQQSCHFAIMEADKLLDIAMKQSGIQGDTMGERLKNAKSKLSDRNGVWTAHKLRNQIVHEADVNVSYDSAKKALGGFKKALRDLGAI